MVLQVGAQSRYVACIQKLHGAAEWDVFNALMVRQTQLISERWFSKVLL
jgi:hypothetical protein